MEGLTIMTEDELMVEENYFIPELSDDDKKLLKSLEKQGLLDDEEVNITNDELLAIAAMEKEDLYFDTEEIKTLRY